MIPKTIAYVWIVVMGLKAMKNESPDNKILTVVHVKTLNISQSKERNYVFIF